MKTILVPVEHHAYAAFPLGLAATLARRFGSVLETFALQRPPLLAPAWDPASAALMDPADWDHRKVVADARAFVEERMGAENLPEIDAVSATPGGAAWRWCTEEMGSDDFLATLARAFDLTVIGQPRTEGTPMSSLEAVLFEGGGPILIAPTFEVGPFGRVVVVAWNGSSETARTIAFARPFLAEAERVVVLADDGSVGHRPTGERIVERLRAYGCAAEVKPMANGSIRSGEAILREARAVGCDLLVKGAYTQSRLRQMIFGGATSHILKEAKVPVLMAH